MRWNKKMQWVIIIAKIIILIAGGLSKEEAVAIAAKRYKISRARIWKHGGF